MLLRLTPQVFTLIAAFIEERSGLFYAATDIDLLASKLSARAAELGFDALLDYYYFLRYDPAGEEECHRLVEALVVHETYFFREEAAIRALLAHVIEPKLRAQPRVRVWCAACATGEEPLTLAILLAERDLLPRVDIVATDISAQALDRARASKHGKRALRAIPAGYDRWLQADQDRAIVDASIIAKVDWRQINLIDAAAIAQLGKFDAVLCRNVLIYFRDDLVRKVVASLVESLRPQGMLQVGVSESLLRFGTALRCLELGGAFFYQRAAE